jgi:hypothetical protein
VAGGPRRARRRLAAGGGHARRAGRHLRLPARGLAAAETRAIVRRVAIPARQLAADPRSRRRRTIDPEPLRLAAVGKLDRVYGYTVILTTLPDDPVAIEAWFRHRADIEARIRDAKLGYALRHLPSGSPAVNRVWLWAALLALNLSAWTQALGVGASRRAHAKRLRRELVCVPGRLIRHARRLVLHLPHAPATSWPPTTGCGRCQAQPADRPGQVPSQPDNAVCDRLVATTARRPRRSRPGWGSSGGHRPGPHAPRTPTTHRHLLC